MLVYGDHSERADANDRLAEISEWLDALARMPPGLDRHAKLITAMVEAGRVLQGAADDGLATSELDGFVHELATNVVRSWDSRFAEIEELPTAPLMAATKPIDLRLPEGFAFYTLYPEAYIDAARRLKLVASPRVIGLRSIGTTLAPIVAAALETAPASTVRPSGDPFARKVELPPDILSGDLHYVVVDEGPGLSGSSFGAVADWLEQRGVPLERIAFLPSHAGELGSEASEAHRARWSRAQRVAAQPNLGFLEERFANLKPFTAGGPAQRTKFHAAHDGAPVVLKFAGLGVIGERKLAIARSLHGARLTPEPIRLVHGFLVERWEEDAQPLGRDDRPLDEIGRYIATRAHLFPASPDSGASIDELLVMCRRNIGLRLGEAAARKLDGFDAKKLSAHVSRVRTDNRMQPDEWIRLGNGRLLKTDALDHHQGHDLIGCQGIEWDVAGAIEEFGLCGEEAARLLQSTGINVDQPLLAFYRVAYAAFRLGQLSLEADAQGVERYARSADHLLHQYS